MIATLTCNRSHIELVWIPVLNPYPNTSFVVMVKELLKDRFDMSYYHLSSYTPLKKPYSYFGTSHDAAYIVLRKSGRKKGRT